MKLVTFQSDEERQAGVFNGEVVVPLATVDPSFAGVSVKQALSRLKELEAKVSGINWDLGLSNAKLVAPISEPEKIICIGLNYADHAAESNSPIPEEPVVFNKFPTALHGPNENIELPPQSDSVDYEAELVVVIGKEGKNIPESILLFTLKTALRYS